ncbi:COMPASS component [Komagataella phaffii CBS 7435]|uniref:COMPASS component n=1 Tax=Komagataella phaffii (strain ATCC 76273 / CBS 7435 / CECT 11047 / NRRL Y-11430 / Wegner 21-1) TaxID=981350 RepID=F2QV39_KOMPC|nr:COMPASS component [Komagataella phaffii CBS 7435]CCA39267.1 COMPASS component [Komagataella phaffii CBS 7435]
MDNNEPLIPQVKQETPISSGATPDLENVMIKEEKSKSPDTQQLTAEQGSVKKRKVEIPAGLEASDIIGGSDVRKWLNKELTFELIEGIKQMAKERPQDCLEWLGQYLLTRSKERKENALENKD